MSRIRPEFIPISIEYPRMSNRVCPGHSGFNDDNRRISRLCPEFIPCVPNVLRGRPGFSGPCREIIEIHRDFVRRISDIWRMLMSRLEIWDIPYVYYLIGNSGCPLDIFQNIRWIYVGPKHSELYDIQGYPMDFNLMVYYKFIHRNTFDEDRRDFSVRNDCESGSSGNVNFVSKLEMVIQILCSSFMSAYQFVLRHLYRRY